MLDEKGIEGIPIKGVDVRRAAMDLLARREHSYKELNNKLIARFSRRSAPVVEGQSLPELVEQVVSILRHEGLQSDARLAEVFIRARSNRGQGPIKIKAELREKGLSDAVIGFAVESCEVDWFELVESVSSRRFGNSVTDIKTKARRSRFLQQRGFSFDHIKTVERN
jgi:regulatory protein